MGFAQTRALRPKFHLGGFSGGRGVIGFSIVDWSAWAPGLHERAAWEAWAQVPVLPRGDDTPPLAEMPALQRRRVERLGRMAMQAAYWCDAQMDASVPMLFASRHGDVARSVALLQALADGEALSPTAFGLSVHNAIAAFHSIVGGGRGNYLAIAGGRGTAEASCVEAAALLADGAPEVRIVCYEAPLPAEYAGYADEAQAFYAWCWRIAPAGKGGAQIELRWDEGVTGLPPETAALPHGLDMHRFLLANEARLSFRDDGRDWTWRRHA